MTMLDFPRELKGVEFSLALFQLEFQETCQVSWESLLRLRRGLRQAAVHVLIEGEVSATTGRERFAALFDPPLPEDPVALRRYQKPAPPFVILPERGLAAGYEAGDVLELPVVFWGRGIHCLADFARTLQVLGSSGLHQGEGLFELAGIEAVDSAGQHRTVWQEGAALDRLAPPLCDACWWMGTAAASGPTLKLEFATPARLLSRGKPLFRISFAHMFPFILRRVTSMVYAHCGVEVVTDPHPLLAASRQVVVSDNQLVWEDWRSLEGDGGRQDLGGIGGSVTLGGDALAQICWVLNLGSLLNLGKGATFGAGHYGLRKVASVGSYA